MSTRYPGGVITKTPVVPAGPFENGTAPGIWTLDQQLQAQKAGIWPTAGNVDPSQFIENIFSTYLYTGNGSTQTITNGIDLSGKGGLVWFKPRNTGNNHNLIDSVRGINKFLISNDTAAQGTSGAGFGISSFNSTGFSLAAPWTSSTNTLDTTMASWTFRKQPKFFDIVTYTGTGANRTIAHNLGSVPGAIWVKRTDAAANWQCYHRSLSNTQYMVLNSSDTVATNADRWNSTTPTSSVFSLGTNTTVNASGGTYVAYIFAHNAGGFGLSGTDNVISCGSYTGTGTTTGPFVNLGYEPQWIIVKRVGAQNWFMLDTMRYWTAGTGGGFSNGAVLQASGPDAEGGIATYAFPTSTGFQVYDTQINASGVDFIYIAIRRGPMKVPTSGTSVYNAIARAGTGAIATVTGVPFPLDLSIIRGRSSGTSWRWGDRLRGVDKYIRSNLANAELTDTDVTSFNMDGITLPATGVSLTNASGTNYINYFFGRAPGFFDEVCYTGSNGFQDLSHNLGVTPQMVIIKNRSSAVNWTVGLQGITGTGKYLVLNSTAAVASDVNYFGSTWTSTNVLIDGNVAPINQSGSNYVMYLFATVAGVSKVGSYTGTGTTQTINCGFTSGARFVMIKRTDSTGDWYVWDSARGIVAGNDPFLLLNSTAAEDTGTDYVDTASSGFEISSTAPAAINANGGSFIFLAIA